MSPHLTCVAPGGEEVDIPAPSLEDVLRAAVERLQHLGVQHQTRNDLMTAAAHVDALEAAVVVLADHVEARKPLSMEPLAASLDLAQALRSQR